jgi:hypothetical protein
MDGRNDSIRNAGKKESGFFEVPAFHAFLINSSMKNKKGEAKRPRRESFFGKLILARAVGDDIHAVAALVKSNFAIGEGEQGPIATGADILPRNELRAALADKNAARRHELTAKSFHAQPLADAVTPVTNAALTFLMCHKIL